MSKFEGFQCIVCGSRIEPKDTGFEARDNKEATVVKCAECGHTQLFPYMGKEEYIKEYNEGTTFKSEEVKIAEGADLETARIKWKEWNKKHIEMYYERLQQHKHVLDLGSGFGFFEESLNQMKGNHFTIEGVDIGQYRREAYVGGVVHNINFSEEKVPENMAGKYDLIISMHLLEHLYDPVNYLQNIKPLFAENSECIFEVPNNDCFLKDLSKEYADFFYLKEHISSYDKNSMRILFEKAGYKVKKIYTKEIYSLENHLNWIRNGKPFIKYNQMYLPDERLEFLNSMYHEYVEKMDKGYSLIIEAEVF